MTHIIFASVMCKKTLPRTSIRPPERHLWPRVLCVANVVAGYDGASEWACNMWRIDVGGQVPVKMIQAENRFFIIFFEIAVF